jgi:hypothetical protein
MMEDSNEECSCEICIDCYNMFNCYSCNECRDFLNFNECVFCANISFDCIDCNKKMIELPDKELYFVCDWCIRFKGDCSGSGADNFLKCNNFKKQDIINILKKLKKDEIKL